MGAERKQLEGPELGQWLTQPCYTIKGPDWVLEGLLLSLRVILGTVLNFFGSLFPHCIHLFIHPLISLFNLIIIYFLSFLLFSEHFSEHHS